MSRAWTFASISSLAALAVAGCFVAIRAATGPSPFDHAAHLKRDLDCADCHEGGKTKAKAGYPAVEFCANCHDPKEPRLSFEPYPRPPSYADVQYDHSRHATLGCATCHTGARSGALANPTGPLIMDACVDCHKERGAKNDCATCHTKLGKDAQPANHEAGWIMHHGAVSQAPDRARVAERCDACHTRADCDSCHTRNPPRDHNNSFRVATHGLTAGMDRSRCMACHQSDSCDRCHRTQPPRSHRPGFGEPANRHCISCHLPVGVSGCVTCHKGTPSHDLAPPKPPGVSAHSAQTTPDQCLACHRDVSHPVTAQDCNGCHR